MNTAKAAVKRNRETEQKRTTFATPSKPSGLSNTPDSAAAYAEQQAQALDARAHNALTDAERKVFESAAQQVRNLQRQGSASEYLATIGGIVAGACSFAASADQKQQQSVGGYLENLGKDILTAGNYQIASASDRYAHAIDSGWDFANYATFGGAGTFADYLDANLKRFNEMLRNPSIGSIANWLSNGAIGTAEGAFTFDYAHPLNQWGDALTLGSAGFAAYTGLGGVSTVKPSALGRAIDRNYPTYGYANGNGRPVTFKSEEKLTEHYNNHGGQLAHVLNRGDYSIHEYLDDARYVVDYGVYSPKANAYFVYIGDGKFGFVGLDRITREITTFHVKDLEHLLKAAPDVIQ